MANITSPAALSPFPGPVPGMDQDVITRAVWGNDNQITAALNALLIALGGSAGAGSALSGTYTPTLFNTTNVAASTAYVCQYLRIGNVVTLSGRVDVDPTGAGQVQLGISLPVASNFAGATECGGTAVAPGVAGMCAALYADATNDRITMEWVTVNTANQDWHFSATYLVT